MTADTEKLLVELFARYVIAQEAQVQNGKAMVENDRTDVENKRKKDEKLYGVVEDMMEAAKASGMFGATGVTATAVNAPYAFAATDVSSFFSMLDHAFIESGGNPSAWGEASANPVSPPFTDERGSIVNVTHQPVGSVSIINSKAGSSRANHYHKADAHLCYVVKGSVDYYQRPVGSTAPATKFTFIAGQCYYTPPNVEHCMKFNEDTTILSLGKLPRTHDIHEADLVRLVEPLA